MTTEAPRPKKIDESIFWKHLLGAVFESLNGPFDKTKLEKSVESFTQDINSLKEKGCEISYLYLEDASTFFVTVDPPKNLTNIKRGMRWLITGTFLVKVT